MCCGPCLNLTVDRCGSRYWEWCDFLSESFAAVLDLVVDLGGWRRCRVLWIGEVPVEVALAGEGGADVSAAHGDHDFGCSTCVGKEEASGTDFDLVSCEVG